MPSGASITFTGLAEGHVLAAFRRAGVSMQRIRPALERLDAGIGLRHALASKGLLTDGVEVLFDYADREGDAAVRNLVVVRDGQHVFRDVVQEYLRCVTLPTSSGPLSSPARTSTGSTRTGSSSAGHRIWRRSAGSDLRQQHADAGT